MGVSKNKGTPKWMIYNGQPYFLMDDLGEKTHYVRNPPQVLLVAPVPFTPRPLTRLVAPPSWSE